jgi:hypothetical protein
VFVFNNVLLAERYDEVAKFMGKKAIMAQNRMLTWETEKMREV